MKNADFMIGRWSLNHIDKFGKEAYIPWKQTVKLLSIIFSHNTLLALTLYKRLRTRANLYKSCTSSANKEIDLYNICIKNYRV